MNAPKPKLARPIGTNPARLHSSLVSYVFALETLKEHGHGLIPVGPDRAALPVDAAIDYARQQCDNLLGEIMDEVARRQRALFGVRPDPKDPYPMLDRIRQILVLEGWDSDSVDEGIECAKDSMEEGGYPEIFDAPTTCGPGGNCGGCGKCSAPAPSTTREEREEEARHAAVQKVEGSP